MRISDLSPFASPILWLIVAWQHSANSAIFSKSSSSASE
jgi:hypothetical protein